MTQETPAVHEGASISQTPAGTESFAPPSEGTASPDSIAPASVPHDDPPTVAGALPESLRNDPSPQPKPEALSRDPLAGAAGDPNRVPSAPVPGSGTPDQSLYEMAKVPQENRPQNTLGGTQRAADQTQVKVFDGPDGSKVEAAASDPRELGPFGMALPQAGEVAGGNIAKTLDPPPDPQVINQPLTRERAALLSPVGRKLAPFIQRPPAEWGIIAPGDVIRGHMLLLNLITGEKHRAMDGHVVNSGELYLNLRNLPESLSSGDTIDQILAAV